MRKFKLGRKRRNQERPRGVSRRLLSWMEAGFVASWFTVEFQEIKWKSFLESEEERISLDTMKYLTDRVREG